MLRLPTAGTAPDTKFFVRVFEQRICSGIRRPRSGRFHRLKAWFATWRRRIAYFAVSLALVVTITGIYHLGFTQYRHHGIGQPETGNVLISMPMLLSTNPIGSIADHMAMHISAVAHTYNTTVRLPPPTKAH